MSTSTVSMKEGDVRRKFALHLMFLVYYIGVLFYDYKLQKKCPDPDMYYPEGKTMGGRWKNLSYITMVSEQISW